MAGPFIRRGRDPRPRDSARTRGALVPKPEVRLVERSKPEPAMQPTDLRSVARFVRGRPLALVRVHGDKQEMSFTERGPPEMGTELENGNGGISIRAGQEDMTGCAPLQTDAYKTLDYNIIIIKYVSPWGEGGMR